MKGSRASKKGNEVVSKEDLINYLRIYEARLSSCDGGTEHVTDRLGCDV